ncbi:GNAT family N-acetyltransferase [Streptomyces stelliscabiei]|uniref:GNAT family N-acetyltransferase n=1 Tax=Streptomyces stelliscabiei TaxID=146820 RepID=UPI0029A66ED2|nr:GNAT family N-acetyltransferase [Streptomyces stelliscabiei]MDX2661108.1 GNAT family N-acetyltransferase [Streptomyces stelliscabiei]MDX2715975.1 GNAT family N-acetyltransferase [Streptomyces stelliscabiei]MDX2790085.1 GNAT family N-acetyltransferase [Streptomyces stelliscabiei]
MAPDIRVLCGKDLLKHTEALHSVYVEAFCAPPWNEDEERAVEFVGRLVDNVRRPGFTAALAFAGADVVGFATAWTTVAPFPTDRCYPQAAAGLGPERTVKWLCGAREIDELAVRPTAHGTGLAAELLEAVTEDAPDDRSWLLTSVRSSRAVAFYRRQGWTQATHPSPEGTGIVVFLGPQHPARFLAPLPL